jgi:tryptophan 2,3-dioxygenase
MNEGLDHDQFMHFRTALTPASGFQSVQYRLIEIYSTGIENLLAPDKRDEALSMTCEQQYGHLYWKKGAIDRTTGNKDLSLINFEKQYDEMLFCKVNGYMRRNLAGKRKLYNDQANNTYELDETLRRFDYLLNIEWRLAHFRSAAKHLRVNKEAVKATGGTNWQTYLPPRFQKVIFFPDLWAAEEKENWGRSFVEQYVFEYQKMETVPQ